MQAGTDVSWFKWEQQEELEQHDYPDSVPHPSKASSVEWKRAIPAKGPIGLLVQSIRRTGLKIDNHSVVWQCKEQPVDLVHVPYQYLAKLVM